ncbi:MAG: selenocysteine-specific translation elongation factor [Alphaproteobacteria bacterium]|nr:selenocysteine-specific translation elongation factor [Alphaproteobacteria bacterium]
MGFVIGTAGHIDHGKTALVRALTGQDTDTLKAEKQRGISIDLGFASFDLSDGTPVGIVDVPGHERFIRNMVAGAHGLDLVLFLIAADDGVMPQTEEHFDIIRALGIKQVIFVISKIGRVDAARQAEVIDEIGLLRDGSRFQEAEILSVDSLLDDGIAELKASIENRLKPVQTLANTAPFRMPIDRVFTIHGRGVVVTGTVLSGCLQAGDVVRLMPDGVTYRVRGLQSHGHEAAQGQKGARLAVNLAAANQADLQRGDVLCAPEIARASQRFDVELHLSPNITAPLRNRQKLRLHLGTAERFAHALLLGEASKLGGGARGFAQMSLDKSCHVMAGDHFVIRDEQGEHTLGGGIVLDPLGVKSRRGLAARLAFLQALSKGDTKAALVALLAGNKGLGLPEADLRFRFGDLSDRLAEPDFVRLANGPESWIAHRHTLEALCRRIKATLQAFHDAQPVEPGMSPSDLQKQTAPCIPNTLFQTVVEIARDKGLIRQNQALYALPDHQSGLDDGQQKQAEALLAKFSQTPFAPPQPTPEKMNATLIAHLVKDGHLLRLSNGTLFLVSAFQEADGLLETHLLANTTITAAEFRDLLGTSRKYALALLETFDRMGRTIRVGDARKRGKPLSANS